MKAFIKFNIVGLMNTLITIISYNILVYFHVYYVAANIIGYLLGVLNSYFWNKNWVFENRSKGNVVFFKFLLVNLLTLGSNTLLLFYFVESIKMSPICFLLLETKFDLLVSLGE
ncbi:GtrA family protein [Caldifermentibacillus hisashii]|uniref:GtrA family protein n=1 Tax=Caldifermentibacillus hisashii TaxID=996558 RepID=UPI0031013E3F|nr:GtrA family protein [Caldibacillus thermoamylovorans]